MNGRNESTSMSEGHPSPPDLDAITLRICQIASIAGALAVAQEPSLSHALHLIEECLLDVEHWVEAIPRPSVEAAG